MYLIGNGRLITRDEKNPYIENGGVVVKDDEILEVGSFETLKDKYGEAEVIDAKGEVIMPGLINAHSHIYSAFARGMNTPGAAPVEFLEILERVWWRLDNSLSIKDVYYSALFTYIECIKNGVTTVVDHHASYGEVKGSLFEIEKAAKLLNVRTCLAYEISDRNGKEKMRQAVEENMDFLQHAKEEKSDMLKGLVGLHAAFTLSDETLDFIKRENSFNAGYHVHIAEGAYDESFSQAHYGKSVVKRLYDYDILGENTLAGHCIHISKEDRKILKQTKTTVVHNPASNMNNAVGYLDILTLLDEGVLVGLGTDGYTNDLLESLKVANILQKHGHKKADRGFNEAITCLFENNKVIATKLFEKEIGVLKKGAKADLIIVDYKPYTPMTKENINGHIMFGMQGNMTDCTMINGKWVMRHKVLQNIDEEVIRNECSKVADAFWKKLNG